ncbi:MAG: GHKL domain-containing protein [Lachnospiraceae bacterium]|nr:GHKL domain-containing protein [Lachnospiraceae bacterium]
MLRKLRERFILSAMAAFGIVMLMLVAGINALNYKVTVDRQDDMLAGIMEYEQIRESRPPGDKPPMISDMPWADGPEADFTTRFFVVHCNGEGQLMDIFHEHISSVDQEEIRQEAERILSGHREKGYWKDYRYMVRQEDAGVTIIFLNVFREQRLIRSLFWVSVVTALLSFCVVLALTVFFSGRAIRPYLRNIERQKRFITDAGHELKTPLTSISTSADILEMELEGDEWVENIKKQTARMTRLVSDLVALSRLDEETPFPEKAEFSISDAAWETAEAFGAAAQAKGKTCMQQIEENLRFTGDRAAIQRLLSILLDNAVRYGAEGGEIRLEVFRRHNRIYLMVSNPCDVEKIPDLNRLFDRFYRPDEARSSDAGGTGIGLSMARAIAEAHGGKITAESRDGRIIIFKVVL